MGKPGRPSKRTASRRAAIVEAIGKGFGLHSAARTCGISPALVALWRNEDPEFRRETDQAREFCADVVEHRLFADAMKGNTLAQLAYLRARRPEFYRAKTVIQGDPDAPLTIDHQHTVGRARVVILPDNSRPALSTEQIQTEREAVERENMIGSGVLIEVEVENADTE
jgi:hypothetical protein